MSFIDNTYFINDINVPLSSNSVLNSNFEGSIDRYEDEILKSLLGYTLWKSLKDDLDDNGDPKTPKFIDLVTGAEFSFDWDGYTINTKWNGLVNSDKESLIAYYVYYKYRRDFESNYTGVGETKSKSENSKHVSPAPKMVVAHNRMVDLYGQIPRRLTRFYPQWFLNNGNYEHFNAEPSAYNFLLANISDYSDWVFKPISKINSFGI